MIWQLIKTSWKEKRTTIIAYSLSAMLLIIIYVVTYPSIKPQLASYNKIIDTLPKGLPQALGFQSTANNFASYIGGKNYGLMWPFILIFMIVSLAGYSIAGSIEKKVLGLWLSAPVSRIRIYWSKYLAIVITLIVFVLFSVTAMIPIANLAHIALSTRGVVILSALGFLFGLAVIGLTMLVSSIFSEKSKVYGIMTGLFLIMYVTNIVANISAHYVNLKYTSFFYYFDTTSALENNHISHLAILIFGCVAVIGAISGALIFRKRDIIL